MSLYRKYRPQSFSNLVGQDHIRTTLMNALKSGKVNHAYLFTGPRGTGKTSTARLVAKAINCLNLKEAEPCEECDICRDITDGRLIDLIEIDAASNRGIDEIRDLREKINFSPTRARSKVYIIDEVHMLTKEAFNALLKTLEEPPAHVYFILATTEVHKIPETILSRCQRFDFKRIDTKTLVDRLGFIAGEEKIEAEADGLDAIARAAQGGLRDAIGLLEQLTVGGKLTFGHVREVLGISGKASLEKLYAFLEASDVQSGIGEITGLYDEGYDLTQFTKDFLELLRQKMLEFVKSGNNAEVGRVLGWIEHFQAAYDGAKYATIPQLPLEVAVVESCIQIQRISGNGVVVGENEKLQSGNVAGARVAGVGEARVHGAMEMANEARMHGSIQPSGQRHGAPTQHFGASVQPHATPPQHYGASVQGAMRKVVPTAVVPRAAVDSSPLDTSHQTQQKAAAISYDVLLSQWPLIVRAIKNVTAKRTLASGKLAGFEGNEVSIAFGTQFHANKLKEFANRLAVEEAMFTVFQVQLKVVPVVDPSLAPANGEASDGPANSAPIDEKTSELLAMMGGELVA